MRNFFFLLLFVLPFVAVSCSDDDSVTPPKVILEADATELEFSGEGEQQSFKFTTNDYFQIQASDDWITWRETGRSPIGNGATTHTITVKVGQGPAAGRNGSIKISAEGATDVVVEIVQTTPLFWNTPTRDRLNLKGEVKTVSEHYSVVEEKWMENLEFNRAGWLTAFRYLSYYGTDWVDQKIEYDGQNRITRLSGRDNLGDYEDITFTYGSDTRWIPMREIYNFIAPDALANLLEWCPEYIRGLESIKVKSGYGFTFTFEIDPSAGTVTQKEQGQADNIYIENMKFEGDFPVELYFNDWGLATKATIEMDWTTGKRKSYSTEDMGGYGFWSKLTFNDDRINSLAEVTSDVENFTLNYNENLDLISKTGDGAMVIQYNSYDEAGNWTSSAHNGTIHNRTVSYY